MDRKCSALFLHINPKVLRCLPSSQERHVCDWPTRCYDRPSSVNVLSVANIENDDLTRIAPDRVEDTIISLSDAVNRILAVHDAVQLFRSWRVWIGSERFNSPFHLSPYFCWKSLKNFQRAFRKGKPVKRGHRANSLYEQACYEVHHHRSTSHANPSVRQDAFVPSLHRLHHLRYLYMGPSLPRLQTRIS